MNSEQQGWWSGATEEISGERVSQTDKRFEWKSCHRDFSWLAWNNQAAEEEDLESCRRVDNQDNQVEGILIEFEILRVMWGSGMWENG